MNFDKLFHMGISGCSAEFHQAESKLWPPPSSTRNTGYSHWHRSLDQSWLCTSAGQLRHRQGVFN